MKNKMPNAAEVWKQLEDALAPRLRLSVLDRCIYSHLLRHSRLEGKHRLRFSIDWLARAVRVSGGPVREAVRRLVSLGVLRLVERTKAGHLVELRLPDEIPAASPSRSRSVNSQPCRAPLGAHGTPHTPEPLVPSPALEDLDFLQTRALRQAIHARERGLCFYCLRRLTPSQKCLDHVVPRVQFGRNSYRNLVSCCVECNSLKSERLARDFFRGLYRDQRLTTLELADRLRALDALAAGKLRPPLALLGTNAAPSSVHSASRKHACRGALPGPEHRRPRVPGGPANPFPHKGRPRKSPLLAG